MGHKCYLWLLADETKIGGIIGSEDGYQELQLDLDQLDKWDKDG